MAGAHATQQDLWLIEDMDEAALPATSDPASHVKRTEKYHQLGEDAMMQILRATLGSIAPAKRTCAIVVDGHMRTTELARATLALQATLGFPVYYWGMALPGIEEEWGTRMLAHHWQEAFLQRKLKIDGFNVDEYERQHADKYDSPLVVEPPKLNVCTWVSEKQVKIPDNLRRKWEDNEDFQSDFHKLEMQFKQLGFLEGSEALKKGLSWEEQDDDTPAAPQEPPLRTAEEEANHCVCM